MSAVTVKTHRAADGRFQSALRQDRIWSLHEAMLLYGRFFAAVCAAQGIDAHAARVLLARYERINFDPVFRHAAYARQVALYLINTEFNVPQTLLAKVACVDHSAVCKAMRAIEDLRDDEDFEDLIALVLALARGHS